jgi:peptidoglycan/LPS O-acetylase OafA/YrhL
VRALALLNHRQHIGSLDAIRGLAILMVFAHHLCPFSADSAAGIVCATLWLGVDLFFVLSGFLITGVLYDTLGQPDFFRNFYARRALRLFPAYIVVVLVVLVLNAVMGGHLTLWTAPYLAYASNIVRDLGHSAGIVTTLDVSHFWSLAVEEQFYLLWAPLIFFARRPRRILIVCVIGTALSVALRFLFVLHPAHYPFGTPYFELPTRLDGLLLGGAVAVLLRSPRTAASLTPARLYAVLITGLVILAENFAAAGHGTMFSAPMVCNGYFAAALTFAVLIALAVTPHSLIANLGRIPLLRLFGRYSYTLYLIHLIPRHWYYLALDAARSHASTPAQRMMIEIDIFAAYLLLCLAVAALSYHTLETFFLHRKRLFLTRTNFALSPRTPWPLRFQFFLFPRVCLCYLRSEQKPSHERLPAPREGAASGTCPGSFRLPPIEFTFNPYNESVDRETQNESASPSRRRSSRPRSCRLRSRARRCSACAASCARHRRPGAGRPATGSQCSRSAKGPGPHHAG